MAIHPIMIPAVQAPSNVQQSAKVVAWTEQATEGLRLVNLSAEGAQRLARGIPVSLTVPLDQRHESGVPEPIGKGLKQSHGTRQVHTSYGRSEPIRRDSLKRREALLKGKEGSRQRRRWENGRLFHRWMI
jgi:R3H-associated N-terminal domain